MRVKQAAMEYRKEDAMNSCYSWQTASWLVLSMKTGLAIRTNHSNTLHSKGGVK